MGEEHNLTQLWCVVEEIDDEHDDLIVAGLNLYQAEQRLSRELFYGCNAYLMKHEDYFA